MSAAPIAIRGLWMVVMKWIFGKVFDSTFRNGVTRTDVGLLCLSGRFLSPVAGLPVADWPQPVWK
ncbi:MAG: hypothetical protein IAB99_09185 [Bacteroidetes bacterium]|uniref:Uncharacterized protein n=1 Tax=Candidatus Cryptobacteroides faecipullorum TaxID=2840764 RepID=A0A9D9NC31_9BACT|nr:hypothetical protein [Candidatus Cryptobacteroides faecipullorum]